MSEKDYYELLGVDRNANDSEIKNFLDEFDGEIEVVTKIKN